MKPLSQVLENSSITSEQSEQSPNSPHMQQHGSTPSDGRTSLSLAPRDKPLTEKQLTGIASSVLLKPSAIITETKKIYGRKECIDEFGHPYTVDNDVIGEQTVTDITLSIAKDVKQSWLESALRPSPVQGIIAPLTHLSLHKRLGSTDQDRAILLRDYIEALKVYPEFVVWLVCKAFWNDNASNFFPKIVALKTLCDTVERAFRRELPTAQIEKPKPQKRLREEESEQGKIVRRKLCDFLVNRGEPDHFEQDRLYSNYQLEGLCASKYRWRIGDPIPPAVAAREDDPFGLPPIDGLID